MIEPIPGTAPNYLGRAILRALPRITVAFWLHAPFPVAFWLRRFAARVIAGPTHAWLHFCWRIIG
jgi:hypothetical protein